MRVELHEAITDFRSDQELALEYLHGHLGIPVPVTNDEWAARGRTQIESVVSVAADDGVQLRKHGHGIEVIHPRFQIDFDYGPAGECDCFDPWRLYQHRSNGRSHSVSSDRDMRDWLVESASAGEVLPVPGTYSFFVWPEMRSQWSAR